MAVNSEKENALLAWINSLELEAPVSKISHLENGCLLVKLIHKFQRREISQSPLDLSQKERLLLVSDFLQSDCKYSNDKGAVLSWENIQEGRNLELELSKLVLLLCYHGVMKGLGSANKLEFKTECEIASMLRFVLDNEDSLYLSDNLEKFLTRNTMFNLSPSSGLSSCSDEWSPVFNRRQSRPTVQFLSLDTVASSSASSPIQNIMNTPQFQLRKLRKELVQEGDLREEMERELANHISTIEERENQISQLNHRIQRMLRDHTELENDHKVSLLELQEKNEGLLRRIHEVLKQCQDLKTDNSQMEKKIDDLTEENGNLSVNMRSVFSRLAIAEEEVNKLTMAQESSQAEWAKKRNLLESELSQAVSQKECLSEQILILQGKISILEDELRGAYAQNQEKGEVMGPIMEEERLKQELADMTLKLAELQRTITRLEKERAEVESTLAGERSSFEKETLRLEGVISDLRQTVGNLLAEQEAQVQASKVQMEALTSQITALERDVVQLQMLEGQLAAEFAVSAELRRECEELEKKVASLEDVVNNLRSRCKVLETESETQQEAFGVLRNDLQRAQVSLLEYESKLADHQQLIEESSSLRARISALDDTVTLLQKELDAERTRAEEALEAKVQKETMLEEAFQNQQQKIQEMLVELDTLSQELRNMKQQKIHAESLVTKLTQESKEMAQGLAEERDQALSTIKGKELEISTLTSEMDNLINKIRIVEESLAASQRQLESSIQETNSKDQTLQSLGQELKQMELTCQQKEAAVLEANQTKRELESTISKLQFEQDNFLAEHQQELKSLVQEKEKMSVLNLSLQRECEASQKLGAELESKLEEERSLACSLREVVEQRETENQNLKEHTQNTQATLLELEGKLAEVLEAKAQKETMMEETFQKQKENIQEMVAKLGSLNQEVLVVKQQRDQAQSLIEKLTNEGREMTQSLTEEHNQALLTIKGKNREIGKLNSEIEDLSNKVRISEEELANSNKQLECTLEESNAKDQTLQSLGQELKRMELTCQQKEAAVLEAKQTKRDLEGTILKLRSEQENVFAEHQQELKSLEQEKEKMFVANQSLKKECEASQKRHAELEGKLEEERSLACSLRQVVEQREKENQNLQEQAQNTHTSLLDYESKLADHLQVVEENASFQTKISALDDAVALLQRDLDAEKKRAEEVEEAKIQKETMMEETMQKQEQKFQAMVADLESLSQELDIVKQQKDQAESLVEKVINEGKAMSQNCTEQQDQVLLTLKSKELEIMKLNSEIEVLSNKIRMSEEEISTSKGQLESAIQETIAKDQTLQSLGQELKQMELTCQQKEAAVLEANQTKRDLEGTILKLQSEQENVLAEHQQELKSLELEKEKMFVEIQSLKMECEASQKLHAELEGKLEEEGSLACSLREVVEQREKEIQNLKEQAQNSHTSLLDYESKLADHQQVVEENASFQTKISALDDAVTLLQRDLDAEKQRAEEVVEAKIQKETMMEETLQKQEQKFQAMVADLKSLSQELDIVKLQKDQAESLVEKVINEGKAMSQNCTEQQDQVLLTLKSKELEIMKLNSEIEVLSNKIRMSEEEISTSKGQLESAIQETIAKDQTLQSLGQELKQMELTCQQKEAAVLEANQTKRDLEGTILKLRSKQENVLAEHQLEQKSLEQEKEKMSVAYTTLETAYETSQKHNVELESKLEEERSLACTLRGIMDQREKENQNLKEQAQNTQALLLEYESKLTDHQRLVEEKAACEAKISTFSDMVTLLQRDLDAEKKQGEELSESKIHKETVMKETLDKQEEKVQQMVAELESLNQELGLVEQQRDQAKSLVEKVTSESKDVARCLTEERDQVLLTIKKKEQEINKLNSEMRSVMTQREKQVQDLEEQLQVKTEKLEHYKAQVEKAKIHYDGKKQQLLEVQSKTQALEHSLDGSEREVKALKAELKLVHSELEDVRISEKKLTNQVNSLQAQVDYADRLLREQKQTVHREEVHHKASAHAKVPEKHHDTSADSLELDMDDSLNTTRRPSVPGESSTPLVRSSERLAAKRGMQGGGSLETLYFTPMSRRGTASSGDGTTERKLESSITSFGELALDSARKPLSSARRRRTMQVINITMTKKTPGGGGEAEDSFYSLHTAQSQPCLASQHRRPVSDIFDDCGSSATASDQLLGLPGYRRSMVHNVAPGRTTSTFCIGAENEPEPDHLGEDWVRIAELQARNKTCLPHLKSSYPLESRPSLGFPSFTVTEDDMRMGDPNDTIRRASMMPGQILDSLSSHRLSLAPGPVTARDGTAAQPHRATMLPGQIRAGTAASRASQVSRPSTRSSTLPLKRGGGEMQGPDTPEAKKMASCFPRPMTPKDRNSTRFGSSNSQNKPPNSPVDRRQSMAFIVDNTPKKQGRSNLLQRGMNKIRSSTRKSPGAGGRTQRSATGKSPGTGRSPLAPKAQRKSPRVGSKSPKIPTSAKKIMNFRMKV